MNQAPDKYTRVSTAFLLAFTSSVLHCPKYNELHTHYIPNSLYAREPKTFVIFCTVSTKFSSKGR